MTYGVSIKINSRTILFISMLLITFSGSIFIVNMDLRSYLEYLGYGLLFLAIFFTYLALPKSYRKKYINTQSILVFCLFSMGILIQDLSWKTKIILLFTMIAILSSSIMAENLVKSWRYVRSMSYGVFFGVIISTGFALMSGINIVEVTSESFLGFNYGFNGGVLYKNYFAADMLAIFIGLYLYRKSANNKRDIDTLIMIISVFFIFISGSRGTYVLFAGFMLVFKYDSVKKIQKNQRMIFVFIIFLVILGLFVFLYQSIALNSETYAYRIRGVFNYLEYYSDDIYHMLLGNADLAYEQEMSYTLAIRSVVGWDGSLEFAWLSILIKNGIVGIIGYIIIFARSLIIAFKSEDWLVRTSCIAVTLTCLVSSLVETYIQSVHATFGIYCYLVMAGLCGNIHMQQDNCIEEIGSR